MSPRHRTPEPRCQVVRTLDIVGEKWSLLIVRDALRGRTRYSEFRESLGVPTDILSARLLSLVDSGILEKRAYRETGSRERASYHLTEAGRGLQVVIAAMLQWNDRFDPAVMRGGLLPESLHDRSHSFARRRKRRLQWCGLPNGRARRLGLLNRWRFQCRCRCGLLRLFFRFVRWKIFFVDVDDFHLRTELAIAAKQNVIPRLFGLTTITRR